MWNIFLFFLLPPRTHLGPITGFIYNNSINGINSFLRKYLNNFLFLINLQILYIRQNKIYFSTELLKKLIKKNKNKIYFNYLLNLIKIRKKYNKKIDFLIYHRNYSVKNNSFRNSLLKKLINFNLRVVAIGDNLKINKITNYGFITRKRTINLLKKTKYIINSGENPYNIFTIDGFNNHTNIIYEKKFKNKIHYFNKQKLFFINFLKNDFNSSLFLNKRLSKVPDSKLENKLNKIYSERKNYFNNVKIFFSS